MAIRQIRAIDRIRKKWIASDCEMRQQPVQQQVGHERGPPSVHSLARPSTATLSLTACHLFRDRAQSPEVRAVDVLPLQKEWGATEASQFPRGSSVASGRSAAQITTRHWSPLELASALTLQTSSLANEARTTISILLTC